MVNLSGVTGKDGVTYYYLNGSWRKGSFLGSAMPEGFSPDAAESAVQKETAEGEAKTTENAKTAQEQAENYGSSGTTTNTNTNTGTGTMASFDDTKNRGLGLKPEVAKTTDIVTDMGEDLAQLDPRKGTDKPDAVTAAPITAAQGTAAQATTQTPITSAQMTAAPVGDLADVQGAQGTVTQTATAQGPEFTDANKVATAQRDAAQETAAQAQTQAFDMNTKSIVDEVTGQQVTVAITPEVEQQQRQALTGVPANTGEATQIINNLGYEAAKRRIVKAEEAKGAAASMVAEVGNIPEDISAAIVEDPATVTAQVDDQPVAVQAAIAALPTSALVSSQMETLLAGMEDGKTPVWARPAVEMVQQTMAARGLTTSTVGRDSLFNAIIQSAMPIAQSNAQALQQRAAQNLTNQQQANLQQSTQDMQRRMTNLANEQTSASQTAQMAQQMNVMQSQFRQDTTVLSAQQQQQTAMQNLQNRQQAATLNLQAQQTTNAQNLGNEQQVILANLQVEAEAEGTDQAATNQQRILEMQTAADFLSKNSAFKQQMDLANLTNDQQMRLANLTALNQASSENLSAAQQTELANLNRTLETNKLQAQIAQQMGLAQLNVDQQSAIQNATTMANIDLTKFNAAQQTELANSKFMQTMTVTDFNANQQSAIQNATAMASMDMAAADQRTKLAITNAQNFLKMDMANLNNSQQTIILNQQLEQQRMLSDQAAQNAAAQFNATSENQTNQFMANLAQQIELQNMAQFNAMEQFNVSENNRAEALNQQNRTDVQKFNNELVTKINQFDAELEYKTDLWNAQNEQAVEQSNIAWRRKANTIDTAAQNAANATAANFAFNMTSAEQNFLWQQARDTAAFAQQSLETKKERAMQLLSSLYGNTELMKDGIAKSGVSSLSKKLEEIIGI
jgi:hypothetical protein